MLWEAPNSKCMKAQDSWNFFWGWGFLLEINWNYPFWISGQDLYRNAVVKDETRLTRLFELQDAVEQARLELCAMTPDAEETQGVAFATVSHMTDRCECLHMELSRSRVFQKGDTEGCLPLVPRKLGCGKRCVSVGGTSGPSCIWGGELRAKKGNPSQSNANVIATPKNRCLPDLTEHHKCEFRVQLPCFPKAIHCQICWSAPHLESGSVGGNF